MIDGWITCDFTSFSTAFQSYPEGADNALCMQKGGGQ